MADIGKRIEANAKIIWGDTCDYDLTIETDDYVDYMCHVRKDFGNSLGPVLVMTAGCPSSDAAWAELDRMLRLLAEKKERPTAMTRDERLEIFGGPQGEYKQLLSSVMDERDRVESSLKPKPAKKEG